MKTLQAKDSHPTETFEITITEYKTTVMEKEFVNKSYSAGNEDFKLKMTPSQMKAIRLKMRCAAWCGDVGEKLTVIIKQYVYFISLNIAPTVDKKHPLTTFNVLFRSEHHTIGKRGKIETSRR